VSSIYFRRNKKNVYFLQSSSPLLSYSRFPYFLRRRTVNVIFPLSDIEVGDVVGLSMSFCGIAPSTTHRPHPHNPICSGSPMHANKVPRHTDKDGFSNIMDNPLLCSKILDFSRSGMYPEVGMNTYLVSRSMGVMVENCGWKYTGISSIVDLKDEESLTWAIDFGKVLERNPTLKPSILDRIVKTRSFALASRFKSEIADLPEELGTAGFDEFLATLDTEVPFRTICCASAALKSGNMSTVKLIETKWPGTLQYISLASYAPTLDDFNTCLEWGKVEMNVVQHTAFKYNAPLPMVKLGHEEYGINYKEIAEDSFNNYAAETVKYLIETVGVVVTVDHLRSAILRENNDVFDLILEHLGDSENLDHLLLPCWKRGTPHMITKLMELCNNQLLSSHDMRYLDDLECFVWMSGNATNAYALWKMIKTRGAPVSEYVLSQAIELEASIETVQEIIKDGYTYVNDFSLFTAVMIKRSDIVEQIVPLYKQKPDQATSGVFLAIVLRHTTCARIMKTLGLPFPMVISSSGLAWTVNLCGNHHTPLLDHFEFENFSLGGWCSRKEALGMERRRKNQNDLLPVINRAMLKWWNELPVIGSLKMLF
jgi:hypothetical protein